MSTVRLLRLTALSRFRPGLASSLFLTIFGLVQLPTSANSLSTSELTLDEVTPVVVLPETQPELKAVPDGNHFWEMARDIAESREVEPLSLVELQKEKSLTALLHEGGV